MSPLSTRRRNHALKDVRVCVVRPLYPENLGAIARAMRVTGFSRLAVVSPAPLADVRSPQARKMAVGAEDILEKAEVYGSLKEALLGADYVVGTSGRVRVASVLPPRDAAGKIVEAVGRGKRVLLLFGSERNGLRKEELALCDLRIRIPMAGSEPTYNLAQAAMIVLYECLVSVI